MRRGDKKYVVIELLKKRNDFYIRTYHIHALIVGCHGFGLVYRHGNRESQGPGSRPNEKKCGR